MPRPLRYPNVPLPPIHPVRLALISSPPPRATRPRALPLSPARTKSLILSAARPRYPVSYVALSKTPRELSLALKLAAAPREPGPLRLRPSNRYLVPVPSSPVLDRGLPLSFAKSCPCPISRRCLNWRPSAPIPRHYSPSTAVPRHVPEMPPMRLYRCLYPSVPKVVTPNYMSIAKEHHALKFHRTARDRVLEKTGKSCLL